MMNGRCVRVLAPALTGLISALWVPAAHAQDLLPPTWRGGPLSTYERWDFSGGPAGGPPDVLPYSNPYGIPMLFPVGGPTWHAIAGPGVPPRPTAWDIGGFARLGASVDNLQTPVPNGVPLGCMQAVVSI